MRHSAHYRSLLQRSSVCYRGRFEENSREADSMAGSGDEDEGREVKPTAGRGPAIPGRGGEWVEFFFAAGIEDAEKQKRLPPGTAHMEINQMSRCGNMFRFLSRKPKRFPAGNVGTFGRQQHGFISVVLVVAPSLVPVLRGRLFLAAVRLSLLGRCVETALRICGVLEHQGIATVVRQEASEVLLDVSNRSNPTTLFLPRQPDSCYRGWSFVGNPSRAWKKSCDKRF